MNEMDVDLGWNEIELEPDEVELISPDIKETIIKDFTKSASKYWGEAQVLDVIDAYEKSGTQYYLLIADFKKHGKKQRLIQTWYKSKKTGEIFPTNKSIQFNEEWSDELSTILLEDFKL